MAGVSSFWGLGSGSSPPFFLFFTGVAGSPAPAPAPAPAPRVVRAAADCHRPPLAAPPLFPAPSPDLRGRHGLTGPGPGLGPDLAVRESDAATLWRRVCEETTAELQLLFEKWQLLLAGLVFQMAQTLILFKIFSWLC
ncbi:unnamed protein product [Miscanthus lutarioriparius]|uniref:Uncharacterized protein n=1 Tax=Miscanthus lutarioriparius TaxID=422564 RepID=A0A811M648_9POAL|nr:unnamed protein product [Miscanthus lutarioriparius]